jgi:hypothetical protein
MSSRPLHVQHTVAFVLMYLLSLSSDRLRSPHRPHGPLRWRPSPIRGSVPLTVPGVLATLDLDMAQKKVSITTLALSGFSASEQMPHTPCTALSRIASVPRIPCPPASAIRESKWPMP